MPPQEPQAQPKREYAQLLRLHEQLLGQFLRANEALLAPGTVGLVKEIKRRTGSAPDLTEIKTAVEHAIRALKMSESEVRSAVIQEVDATCDIEGVSNMSAYLQGFLAERAQEPGFSYQVEQDSVRGWIISWKEFTHRGTVRGYGRFSERSYAWLED